MFFYQTVLHQDLAILVAKLQMTVLHNYFNAAN